MEGQRESDTENEKLVSSIALSAVGATLHRQKRFTEYPHYKAQATRQSGTLRPAQHLHHAATVSGVLTFVELCAHISSHDNNAAVALSNSHKTVVRVTALSYSSDPQLLSKELIMNKPTRTQKPSTSSWLTSSLITWSETTRRAQASCNPESSSRKTCRRTLSAAQASMRCFKSTVVCRPVAAGISTDNQITVGTDKRTTKTSTLSHFESRVLRLKNKGHGNHEGSQRGFSIMLLQSFRYKRMRIMAALPVMSATLSTIAMTNPTSKRQSLQGMRCNAKEEIYMYLHSALDSVPCQFLVRPIYSSHRRQCFFRTINCPTYRQNLISIFAFVPLDVPQQRDQT